ncbi:hypothetical protein ABEY82_15480 [Priestia megaterium]
MEFRQNSVYWGAAIIPAAYLSYCGRIFTTHRVDHSIRATLLMLLEEMDP